MDKPAGDREAQRKRFIETARALECDEDKERFEAQLKRIAKTTRSPDIKAHTRPTKP